MNLLVTSCQLLTVVDAHSGERDRSGSGIDRKKLIQDQPMYVRGSIMYYYMRDC